VSPKTTRDAPDPGAVIPGVGGGKVCGPRAIRLHATTHCVPDNPKRESRRDVFSTRCDEYVHVINVCGDVDSATAGDLLQRPTHDVSAVPITCRPTRSTSYPRRGDI
jgi:hypothetical protein